jgi:hypothetical protein
MLSSLARLSAAELRKTIRYSMRPSVADLSRQPSISPDCLAYLSAQAKLSVLIPRCVDRFPIHDLSCLKMYRMWHLGHSAHLQAAPSTVQRIVHSNSRR